MKKNRIELLKDPPGLRCECGNEEVLGNKDRYDTFECFWSTKTGRGIAVASCKVCHSDVDEVLDRLLPRSI